MNTRFKVFTSYNILQYLCDFIHVLIFVTVSKCRKIPKLTNIVIHSPLVGYVVHMTGLELYLAYVALSNDSEKTDYMIIITTR